MWNKISTSINNNGIQDATQSREPAQQEETEAGIQSIQQDFNQRGETPHSRELSEAINIIDLAEQTSHKKNKEVTSAPDDFKTKSPVVTRVPSDQTKDNAGPKFPSNKERVQAATPSATPRHTSLPHSLQRIRSDSSDSNFTSVSQRHYPNQPRSSNQMSSTQSQDILPEGDYQGSKNWMNSSSKIKTWLNLQQQITSTTGHGNQMASGTHIQSGMPPNQSLSKHPPYQRHPSESLGHTTPPSQYLSRPSVLRPSASTSGIGSQSGIKADPGHVIHADAELDPRKSWIKKDPLKWTVSRSPKILSN